MRARQVFRGHAGFTLVEVMVAIALLLVGVLGVVAMADTANDRTGASKAREGATNLARDLIESTRSVPFANITQSELQGQLEGKSGLGDSASGGAWQVTRRNVTYTITYSVCSIDDGSDGIAATHDSGFCSGTSSWTAGRVDRDGVDFKRVTFTVAWDRRGAQSVTQSALVNTTYRGPSIKTISASPSGTITSPSTASIHFTAETASPATDMTWYLDGSTQGPAAFSSPSWTFDWDLGTPACSAGTVEDGTYFVSAAAYDRNGATGGPKATTVDINRCIPQAPQNLVGGRNWGSVELRWDANSERDIVGYRVYRDTTAVCGASTPITETHCRDTSAPNSGPLSYTVVAFDRDGGTYRAGPASTGLDVLPDCGSSPCNTPPSAPTIAAAPSPDTLTITEPAAPRDPDASDDIAFYRVYRTSNGGAPTSESQRYETVDYTGSTVTWRDSDPGSWTYWVVAVDKHYSESPFSNSVP